MQNNTLNFKTLDSILLLKDNWNENGAKPFKVELIEKCKKALMTLPDGLRETCFIAPTARNTIQFEWDKDEKYFEVEVFETFIKLFVVFEDNDFVSETFSDERQINNVVKRLALLMLEER